MYLGIWAAIAATVTPVRAIVLDWSTVAWTPGSLVNSYDIDPNSPGADITISIAGNTNKLTTDPLTGVQTPTIDSSLQGGLSPVNQALDLAANIKKNEVIVVTVTFSPQYSLGVNNVTFSLFDVDLQKDKDKIINIRGTAVGGAPVAANITNLGSSVSLSGSGLGQILTGVAASPNTGPNSGNGNVTIDFGSTGLTGFTFTFGNSAGGPQLQQIALFDISFTAVPEMNPVAITSVLCGVAGLMFIRRRQRRV